MLSLSTTYIRLTGVLVAALIVCSLASAQVSAPEKGRGYWGPDRTRPVPPEDELLMKLFEKLRNAWYAGRYSDWMAVDAKVRRRESELGIVRRDPNSPFHAFCLYQTGKATETACEFEATIYYNNITMNSSDQTDIETYLRYAQVLADLGRFGEACDAYEHGMSKWGIYYKEDPNHNGPWTEDGFRVRDYGVSTLKAVTRVAVARLRLSGSLEEVQSLQDCTEAMSLKPDLAVVRYYSAMTRRAFNNNHKRYDGQLVRGDARVDREAREDLRIASATGHGAVRKSAEKVFSSN